MSLREYNEIWEKINKLIFNTEVSFDEKTEKSYYGDVIDKSLLDTILRQYLTS